jgi:hypothetical protein
MLRPPLLVVYLLAVVVQQYNNIVYNLSVVEQQCTYSVALPLLKNKEPIMVDMAFYISEVAYLMSHNSIVTEPCGAVCSVLT